MAVNDPYGLIASGLPPEMAAEAMGLTRRQAVMQALMEQAQQPSQTPTNKGRIESRASWLAPIAKMMQAYVGASGAQDTDKAYSDLAVKRQQAVADAMAGYERMKGGAPAQNIPLPTPNDDEGNPMPAASTPAVAGDPRAAIAQALQNPLLRGSPLVAQDLKVIEKQAEPFTMKPDEKRFVGDKVVAAAPPSLVQVTTTDDKGNPVVKFVPKTADAAALPAPVKAEYQNTGGSVQQVPAYVAPGAAPTVIPKTVSPDTLAHVAATERGQNMTDARQREINMIAEGTAGPEVIEGNAKAIAEGKLPPLSGFALKSPMGMRIMGRVMEINPEYNAQDYGSSQKAVKDFAIGKQGNTVRSFNVALTHLDTLGNLATALQNNDLPAVNKLGQFYAQQTGSAAPTNFDAAKKIVGDEIVKAIVGSGGGVADREEASKTIGRANSPEQLAGAINTYKELMRGQLQGLRLQYEQSTGRNDFDRFLSDNAKKGESPQRRATDSSPTLKFDAQGNQIK